MWNRRNVFIQIFILLLMRISQIQSYCSWDSTSVENCSLKCNSKDKEYIPYVNNLKTIATIMANLDKIWTERAVCHEDGLDLKLENIKYPDNTVAANFFTSSVKVKTLTIKLNYMWLSDAKSEKIETDAFNRDGLRHIKKLVISNAMFEPIKKGTFNGLVDLEVLKIEGTLGRIEAGVLDGLNGTLREFSLEESFSSSKEILIDGLTGAGALDKLETVKFKYNLKTSITRASFTGLTNVKTLDLSECQIRSVALGSFDSLHSLEILQLKNNQLTTISDTFFSNILMRNKTQIYLEGNRFLCDCALMPFRLSLMEHSNFIGQLTCDKPDYFAGYKIIEPITNNFFETCVPPTTTTFSPPPSSPTFSTKSPTRQCQLSDKSETVFVDPTAHTMRIYQTEDDDVMLRVDDNLPENSILIWFSINDATTNNLTAVNPNCLIGNAWETTFHIENLVTNSAYTLCLMDHTNLRTSPLDCVSFAKRSGAFGPWIYHNAKSRFIGITFVACSVSIFLGSAIGGWTYNWTKKRKEPFIRSYQSSRCSSMSRSRTSMMTRRTTNTTVQYFINGNYDDAPPLPARPASMYLIDEPVYATIRDFRSILAPSQAPHNLQVSSDLETI